MRGTLVKVFLIIMIIGIIVYAGACVYANFIEPNMSKQEVIQAPKVETASYEVIIVNTGTVYLSNQVSRVGSFVKMEGYWELVGTKYVSRNRTILLDENIFGKISVNMRSK